MNGANFPKTTEKEWRQAAQKLLTEQSFQERLYTKTDEGLQLKPIYFATDSKDVVIPQSLKDCLIAQTLFADQWHFNTLAKNVLRSGQTALIANLDISSQLGIEYPSAENAIRLQDYTTFKELFSGIDTGRVALFFNAFNTADNLYNWWIQWSRENLCDLLVSRVALGADPISAALIYGGFAHPWTETLEKLVAAINDKIHHPALDVLTIHGDIIHNSGGHMVQQLVYILGVITAYVNELAEQGIEPSTVLSSIRIKVAVGNEQFMEIAKLRALRLLWHNVCKAYQANDLPVKIDAVTSWRWLSDKDLYNNMLRATGQAFSAVIGDCNTIEVLPFDLATRIPDDFSMRQARNVPVVMYEEASLNKVADPSAGSYYLDHITIELAEKSWQAFQQLENQGGIYKSVKSGQFQAEIKSNALHQESEIKSGFKKAIGINCYMVDESTKKTEMKDYYYQQQRLFDEIEPLLLKRLL